MENNNKRRIDLSSKFLEMGQALLKEGMDSKDFCISQSGSLFIFLGSLITNDKDMYEFCNLTSMFASKKILDDLEENKSDLTEYLKNKGGQNSYEELIKRLNKLKDGEEPMI